MRPPLTFVVDGRPAPQGSKAYKGHRGGKPILVEQSRHVAPWRALVAAKARAETDDPFTTPVAVTIIFNLPRPASHYGTGRNGDVLKDSAPPFPAVRNGDIDKLARAVLDGLTGPALADDSLVVDLIAHKRYCHRSQAPGALITIKPL